jgi:hypothetical protein
MSGWRLSTRITRRPRRMGWFSFFPFLPRPVRLGYMVVKGLRALRALL